MSFLEAYFSMNNRSKSFVVVFVDFFVEEFFGFVE
jgi:hypothetical protein